MLLMPPLLSPIAVDESNGAESVRISGRSTGDFRQC
jgi:hypothetical protein